jgi:hypothetical protein
MYKKNDLSNIFGKSDEAFKAKFDDTLANLMAQERSQPQRRRMSIGAIVTIIVVCALMLTGTAYAVSQINFQFNRQVDDVDMGGPLILISIPEEEYQDEHGWRYGYLYLFYAPEHQPVIRVQTVERLREQLRSSVFAHDGQPFDLFVPIPDSNDYYASSRGNALFNELGEEIAEIYFSYFDDGIPRVSIMNVADYEAMIAMQDDSDYFVTTVDYSKAADRLGMSFRLPGIFTDLFEPPEFRVQLPIPHATQDENGAVIEETFLRSEVRVWYNGEPGIYFFATPLRNEDTFLQEWYLVDSIIEEGLIADTVVYKIVNDSMIRYTWEHEGLIYMLFNFFDVPDQFTDEQFIEIIWSMIK